MSRTKIVSICCVVFMLCISQIAIASKKNADVKEYPWFKDSFLELPEDLAEARKKGRGLILYFHQEGCPYCKKLLNDNFSRPELVQKLTQKYDFLALNLWGDRPVIDVDGSELTEKTLAVKLKVMFTPTLIFLNSHGKVEFRLNGYYSPFKFNTLLDYLASQRKISFSQYYRQLSQGQLTSPSSHAARSSRQDYQQLYRQSKKPLLLILNEKKCRECEELYAYLRGDQDFKPLISRFNISRLDIHSEQMINNINGENMTAADWADQLNVQHIPTLIFYAPGQQPNQKVLETFRLASYVRKFHLESVLLYIADKKYLEYPEFQRYIHDRTAKLREEGVQFDLWN